MRTGLAVLGVCCLLLAAVAPAVAIHETGRELVVSLETDGDATVTKVTKYNLSNDTQRRTFERLESNETARQQRVDAYRDYLAEGAAIARQRTDRDVAVGEVTVNLTRRNGTGVVRLRGRWSNVAAVDGPHVVLTEPFASGLPVNRTLVVRGPDGYVRVHTQPSPARALRNQASWGQATDLSGFTAVFRDPDAATATATATQSPVPETPTPGPVTTDGLLRLVGAASVAAVPALLVAFAFRREGR